jgi:hypothetical protein
VLDAARSPRSLPLFARSRSAAAPTLVLPLVVLSEREMERGRGCRKQAKAGASALSRLRADLGASSTGARVADARRGADRNAELPFS